MPSSHSALTEKINAYFAVLLITIFGAFITLIIIRIIDANTIIIVSSHNAVIYTYLQ